MFHLRRIVRILKELKAKYSYVDEIGVIIDHCSLWQKGSGDVDKRSEAQKEEFGKGLEEINTPYAHQESIAVKLMAVPDTVPRKYDDRG